MTQEDKDLLSRDLCARLPYGVKVCCNNTVYNIDAYTKSAFIIAESLKPDVCLVAHIEEVKPYLFPMSSMTEEHSIYMEKNKLIIASSETESIMNPDGYDFLNKNHYDYRGLIPKGLAIDATGLNVY